MRGWIDLGSDVNWEDYGGTWGRKAPDGSWYVLCWTNLLDTGGSEFADCPFECDVKRLDLASLPDDALHSALRSSGWELTSEGVVNSHDGDTIADTSHAESAIVGACIGYGLGAPLESFTGAKYPTRIRANARRFAEECMRDAAKLESRLDRPVNRLGSTAREYGIGDTDSALYRDGGDTTAKGILRKMIGFPTLGGGIFGVNNGRREP